MTRVFTGSHFSEEFSAALEQCCLANHGVYCRQSNKKDSVFVYEGKALLITVGKEQFEKKACEDVARIVCIMTKYGRDLLLKEFAKAEEFFGLYKEDHAAEPVQQTPRSKPIINTHSFPSRSEATRPFVAPHLVGSESTLLGATCGVMLPMFWSK